MRMQGLCFPLCMLFWALPVLQSATPYVGKRVRTGVRTEIETGQRTVLYKNELTELRSSRGDTLKERVSEPGTYDLYQADTKEAYILKPQTKEAWRYPIGQRVPMSKTPELRAQWRKSIIGQKTVLGVPCDIFPVIPKPALDGFEGTACESAEYDLVLELRVSSPQSNGKFKLENTEQVTELQLGLEPPADRFRVPPDYQVRQLP